MRISIIVAIDENGLIGRDNGLPWHLPADLKYFKSVTMGHHMIMGRKTFESIGKALPGRVSVVITRQKEYHPENTLVVHSLEDALLACRGESEVFIIGGAQIFRDGMAVATDLYVTKIHHRFEGDIFFPEISPVVWEETFREDHVADEKNRWDYSYIRYKRKS